MKIIQFLFKTSIVLTPFLLMGCQGSFEQAVYEADSIEIWQQNPPSQKQVNDTYRELGIDVKFHPDND